MNNKNSLFLAFFIFLPITLSGSIQHQKEVLSIQNPVESLPNLPINTQQSQNPIISVIPKNHTIKMLFQGLTNYEEVSILKQLLMVTPAVRDVKVLRSNIDKENKRHSFVSFQINMGNIQASNLATLLNRVKNKAVKGGIIGDSIQGSISFSDYSNAQRRFLHGLSIAKLTPNLITYDIDSEKIEQAIRLGK